MVVFTTLHIPAPIVFICRYWRQKRFRLIKKKTNFQKGRQISVVMDSKKVLVSVQLICGGMVAVLNDEVSILKPLLVTPL